MDKEIIAAIQAALKRFGEYSYYDKGASEIMDVGVWEKKLNALPLAERVAILESVLDHEHGEQFVRSVVMNSDGNDDFDEFLDASPRLAEFY